VQLYILEIFTKIWWKNLNLSKLDKNKILYMNTCLCGTLAMIGLHSSNCVLYEVGAEANQFLYLRQVVFCVRYELRLNKQLSIEYYL